MLGLSHRYLCKYTTFVNILLIYSHFKPGKPFFGNTLYTLNKVHSIIYFVKNASTSGKYLQLEISLYDRVHVILYVHGFLISERSSYY